MIRFDKLTLKGQEALQSAQSHAQEKGNPQVAPEHLLWALIEQKDGVVLPVLQKLGVNLQTIAHEMADAVAISCAIVRSEEHTSELQSPDHLVCRLLLEKKK